MPSPSLSLSLDYMSILEGGGGGGRLRPIVRCFDSPYTHDVFSLVDFKHFIQDLFGLE